MTIQDTADALYDAVMLDVMPRISACVDFGLDIQPELYSIYQDKVRKGDITLEDLRDFLGLKTTIDSKSLPKSLGS